jgi:hypothetical protein
LIGGGYFACYGGKIIGFVGGPDTLSGSTSAPKLTVPLAYLQQYMQKKGFVHNSCNPLPAHQFWEQFPLDIVESMNIFG